MTSMLTVAFALALASSTAPAPRFAEDIPKGVGDGAIFELTLADDGHVTTCTFASLVEFPGQLKSGGASESYVADACRKLSTRPWQVRKAETDEIKSTFYHCRRLDASPDVAFCEERFGE